MYPQKFYTLSPRTITAIYLVFGLSWIVVTDWAVFMVAETSETVSLLQTIKGWIFVIISGALILGLTGLRQRQIEIGQEKLERATEQLQVFHRFLRHNLRNDLTVIQGNVREVEVALDTSSKRDRLETARKTAENMHVRSEKMRIIDKIDLFGSPTDTEVDLVELTTNEIASIRDEYPAVDISVTAPEAVLVRGQTELRLAIYELLDNAIVHNPSPAECCEVEVSIYRDNGTVTLAIEDNGPGIDDAELTVLEEKEETELSHMSGVGLWLATWLTEYFDGRLEVVTGAGNGTAARLHLEPSHPGRSVG